MSVPDVDSSEIKPLHPNDIKCAPTHKYIDGSCISLDVLVEMANMYNSENSGDKIILNQSVETLTPGKYKRYLVRQFRKRYKTCKDQRCWIKRAFNGKKYVETDFYRPSGPQGKFEWLNTININDVMEQYQKKYSDFKFLGAVPIDFDELPQLGIADLSLKKSKEEGKTKLGIIFNLDEHYKSGSHWVAGFTDVDSGLVYFFDSYGTVPEERIRKLMRRWAREIRELNAKEPTVVHNKHRHQYDNYDCGTYSINFILRLLNGDTFDEITKNKISDKIINRCRNAYFNNYPENVEIPKICSV